MPEFVDAIAAGAISLRESVARALENYFGQLGNQKPSEVYDMVMREVEEPLLRKMMVYTNNNQSLTAKLLGLSRGTLRKKLKLYDML